MRSLRLNEREDPQPFLDKLRESGDDHRLYYNDFTDKDLVDTFLVEAVGEWRTTGGPYRTWEGTGKPCFVCYMTWGLTDVHAETKGLCPWVCKTAFSDGRAPPFAREPVPRQPPPHETPPVAGERKATAAFTFRPLDPVTAVDADPLAAPLDPGLLYILPEPGADEASTDNDELDKPTLAMIAGEESDDEDLPAFASGPAWIPPLSRQSI
ncbi:hypothetical protein CYMTET_11881 [Cymbomonas tetramitiformis]|uniref:Uncharacterized protein n=1 Tax=Cymbomonas tetramitiformis TaxID=36881 RepID=A0AAE0GLU0_9CHLO|nr:hypothetical protein CYMTET_11881 [Cymbomonas tetramitiformis]